LAEAESFSDLVHEAFIKPLRSVLIVDDQYPTWEEIFNSKLETGPKSAIEAKSKEKMWHSSDTATEVFRLVSEFRHQNPGLIIDIHDGVSKEPGGKTTGSETPQQLADHLHQSDLLILDYNLEGGETGTGGATARQILSSVLSNQHFNLVVVHTSENLDEVFYECAIALMQSCSSQYDEKLERELDQLDDIIDEAEAIEEFHRDNLVSLYDKALYSEVRSPETGKALFGAYMRGVGKLWALSVISDSIKLKAAQKKSFFFWALREYEKSIQFLFATGGSPKGLVWNGGAATKWLRTSRGFVCFVKKGPVRLLDDLRASLEDWRPNPSRLLSAKYRYEISRMGADVEDESLRQKHAYAKFYDTILKPSELELEQEQIELLRAQNLKQHVARQSEMLSFLVEDEVIDFGARVIASDNRGGNTFHEHYDVDLANPDQNSEAIWQYNRHVCCLPSKVAKDDGEKKEQLDSGHIFKIGDEWWVCATPACDLQPGQNTIAFSKGSDKSLRPFTALKLHQVTKLNSREHTSRHINSGSYCYIDFKDTVIGLGTKPSDDDIRYPGDVKVAWRSMIAKNGGVIVNGKLELLDIQLELDGDRIRSALKTAEVVAKLRYEYALNFIQRVGGSVSRIGLGYVT